MAQGDTGVVAQGGTGLVAADAGALLQSASKCAEEGDMPGSKALFEEAAHAARAEGSAKLEREACLGAAEVSWQVVQAWREKENNMWRFLYVLVREKLPAHTDAECTWKGNNHSMVTEQY